MNRKRPMSKKKKTRLGKGLGALLGDVRQTAGPAPAPEQPATPAATSDDGATAPAGLRNIPIELLQRGQYQPRLHMDREALEELAESIRSQGIIQPLLVRRLAGENYEIIAGERRWRGAQLAGLDTVPAVVREISDETAMAVALIENIQRQDLNAIEEAMGLQRLLDEFGLTHEEVAASVGRSRTAVTNTLRLLNLNASVRRMVETGELGMGHARALLGLPDERQPEGARKVVKGGLSVRATEHMVKRMTKVRAVDKARDDGAANDIRRLEGELSDRIQARVEIRHGNRKGRLVIHYHSLDELDGILERIR